MTPPLATPTDELSREEWLDARQTGIGGSDVAPICGLSRWQTPLGVWLEKTGMYRAPDQPSEEMEWGSILEPVVADEFTRRTGIPTEEHRFLLRSAEHPFMVGNIDRRIPPQEGPGAYASAPGVYEGKCTGAWQAGEWADGQVPDYAALQTHHYLAVTGWAYAYVAVLIGGNRMEWRRIERDDDLIAHLTAIESEFWSRVIDLDPPAPTAADSKLLGDVWTPDPDECVTFSDEHLALLAERADAKRAEKAAKERAEVAEAHLKLAMGEAAYGLNQYGEIVCSWTEIPGGHVEYDREPYRKFLPRRTKLDKAS